MLRSIAIALLLAWLAIADEAKGDLKKMEGTWEATLYIADGKKWSAKERATLKLIIKGAGENELVVGKERYFGRYKLNESATPKTIDIPLTRGPHKGETKLGIYELSRRPKVL